MDEWTFTIISHERIAHETYELRLGAEGFTAEAGQFVNIKIPNAPQLTLRRPLSIHMIEEDGIRIQYMTRGEGTTLLSQVKAGETLTATAPLGRGFDTQDFDNVWLLGGGIGVPPLYTVAQKGIASRAFLGFRSKEFVIDEERFSALCKTKLYTDDGSAGNTGFALDSLLNALKSEKPNAVFACGPKLMYKMLKERLPKDVRCFISLEERMGCGIGACLVCACKAGGKKQRVCKDGPVFELQEVELDG